MSKTVDLISFEELFNKYSCQYDNKRMTEQQAENLKYWHERMEKCGITISQIDHWLHESQIIPKVLTIFDTGIVFARLK